MVYIRNQYRICSIKLHFIKNTSTMTTIPCMYGDFGSRKEFFNCFTTTARRPARRTLEAAKAGACCQSYYLKLFYGHAVYLYIPTVRRKLRSNNGRGALANAKRRAGENLSAETGARPTTDGRAQSKVRRARR